MKASELIDILMANPDAEVIVSGGVHEGVTVENWEVKDVEYAPISQEFILTQEKDEDYLI